MWRKTANFALVFAVVASLAGFAGSMFEYYLGLTEVKIVGTATMSASGEEIVARLEELQARVTDLESNNQTPGSPSDTDSSGTIDPRLVNRIELVEKQQGELMALLGTSDPEQVVRVLRLHDAIQNVREEIAELSDRTKERQLNFETGIRREIDGTDNLIIGIFVTLGGLVFTALFNLVLGRRTVRQG